VAIERQDVKSAEHDEAQRTRGIAALKKVLTD
jgi:hypothetical protein